MEQNSRQRQLDFLRKYRQCNPHDIDELGFRKIQFNIDTPRQEMVYDEYVDFLLWCNGRPGRQEAFLQHLTDHVLNGTNVHKKILEIGCGKSAWLSLQLADRGYELTCIDPKLDMTISHPGMYLCSILFDYRDEFCQQFVSSNDLVIAQEPCEAAEHIARACEMLKVPYYMVLCGAPHRKMDGIMPLDVWEWYDYLKQVCPLSVIEKTAISGLNYYVMHSDDL